VSYEPRGKMIDLLAAIRSEPERAFSMKEVCAVLGCKAYRSTVDQYIYAAINDGQMFKREIDGAVYYAGAPVSDAILTKSGIQLPPRRGQGGLIPTGSRSQAEIDAARSDVRAPKFDGPWTPPRMVAPRPGSDIAHVAEKPQELPSPPAAPAPAPVKASIPEGAGAETEEAAKEQEEAVEFNAALWLDGDLVIYGAIETEDGGVLIKKDQLDKLKRLITWSGV
jgi:hypothetical protein